MDSEEIKCKTLEMIQAAIVRMSSNSFSLKGWAVTLVSGIAALSNRDAEKMLFLLAYIPVIMFWLLDAYFLRQERLYRNLFEATRAKVSNMVNYDLNANKLDYQDKNTVYCLCLLSKTELWFYFPLAVLAFVFHYLGITIGEGNGTQDIRFI